MQNQPFVWPKQGQLGADTVWRFSQCVLAEIETLQLLNGASSTKATGSLTSQLQESGEVAAKVKSIGTQKQKGKEKGTPGQVGKTVQFLRVKKKDAKQDIASINMTGTTFKTNKDDAGIVQVPPT